MKSNDKYIAVLEIAYRIPSGIYKNEFSPIKAIQRKIKGLKQVEAKEYLELGKELLNKSYELLKRKNHFLFDLYREKKQIEPHNLKFPDIEKELGERFPCFSKEAIRYSIWISAIKILR